MPFALALRPVSIRLLLLALVVACLLPAIALTAVLIARQTAEQRAAVEAQLLAQVRTLSLAIEREIAASRTALAVLARSKELEERDFRGFHELAVDTAQNIGGAAYITLVDADAMRVITALPYTGPRSVSDGPALRAFESTLPVVTDLYTGPESRLLLVGIGVPLRTAGPEARYYGLGVGMPPDRFSAILRAQQLPEGWQSGMIDGSGHVIARSNERQRATGERGNDRLIEASRQSDHGLFRTTSRRGEETLGAFTRVPGTNWTTRVSVPLSVVESGRRESLAYLALGGGIVLLASLAGAALLARRIVRPLRALEEAASRLGDDKPLVLDNARSLRETASVGTALATAHAGLLEAQATRAAAERSARAQAQAEAASRAKSAFLAQVSHELRTPISGVIGLADVLLLEPLAPQAQSRVRVLRSTAAALQKMLDDLLDFARIEADRLVIDTVPFEPAALVTEVFELFRPSAAAKGVAMSLETATSGRVIGDPDRLREVLSNVIGNAVKFTASGRIVVRMDSVEAGRRLAVSVEDSGRGIAEEAIERVFEPFTQESPEIARRYGGTGLGLAISRRLVEAMGGSIRAARSASGGTVIAFDIAVTPVPQPEGAVDAGTGSQGPVDASTIDGRSSGPRPLRRPRPLRILVAEDNAVIRDTEAAMLARMGHSVMCVANGRLALDALRTMPFDIVLMDIRMPVMDGLEALARIREAPALRDLPVIAISAAVDETSGARDSRFDATFAKPVDWDLLQDAMARLTDHRPPVPGAHEHPAAKATAAAFAMDRPIGDLFDAFRKLLDEGANQHAAGDADGLRETIHTIAGIGGIFGCEAVTAAVRATRELPPAERFGPIARAVRDTLADLESATATEGPRMDAGRKVDALGN